MMDPERIMRESIYGREGVIPERLLEDLANPPNYHNGELTPAEIQVVNCLSHGLTDRMAAEVLGRSFHTVRRQIQNARAALDAKNKAHLVAIALRQGLIS